MGMYRVINLDADKLELHLLTKDHINQVCNEGAYIYMTSAADINDTMVMQGFFNPEDPLFEELEYLIMATENNHLSGCAFEPFFLLTTACCYETTHTDLIYLSDPQTTVYKYRHHQ